MEKHSKILYLGLAFVFSQKRFWLLGFLQVFSLLLVLRRLYPAWWSAWPRALWELGLLVVFSIASVLLWYSIKAFSERKNLQLSVIKFGTATFRVLLVAAGGVILALGLKSLFSHWTIIALLSSIIGVSAVATMLAVALYDLDIARSIRVTIDLWRHKLSLISGAVFTAIAANGFAFYFVHALWPMTEGTTRFSVSPPSATIWILFLVLSIVSAFFATLFNACLVLWFLDIAKPKKATENLQIPVAQPAGI